MTGLTSQEIRKRFLDFFKKRRHAIIPSASLVPENDPTTLFTGSGMQPMVPYLLGEKHPLGTRIADSQKCFRTVDIDEVGDNRHTTFFEMLGNWSLGDYFKKEQIPWMFEFLTEEIGIDPKKLYVTVFVGDKKNNISKDTESAEIWKKLFEQKGIDSKEVEIGNEENGYTVGMQGGRIFYYDVKKNWWSRAGVPDNMPTGEPGGADSEMFYEFTEIEHDKKFGENCHPNCDCGRFLEIGNNVFMEYKKNSDGTFSKLPQNNVDFGGGLERIAMAVQNSPDIVKTNHRAIIDYIEKVSGKIYGENSQQTKAFRVIADHIKASVFLIADGVIPSNVDQGYFTRRLIRRAIRYGKELNMPIFTKELAKIVIAMYIDVFPELMKNSNFILNNISKEEEKLEKNLERENKIVDASFSPSPSPSEDESIAEELFKLKTQEGIPLEVSLKKIKDRGIEITPETIVIYNEKIKEHQELSRAGSEQKFKGGLGGTGEIEIKYHTATHLLHQALRDVLGDTVQQKGSNITAERLRFDFTHDSKMTDEEKKKVEDIVNEKIQAKLPMQKIVMKKEDAEKTGALHFFGDKYGDEVSVYFIGDALDTAYSKEFCGGHHVENIGILGHFKIVKEEAVSAGIRRIKATLN